MGKFIKLDHRNHDKLPCGRYDHNPTTLRSQRSSTLSQRTIVTTLETTKTAKLKIIKMTLGIHSKPCTHKSHTQINSTRDISDPWNRQNMNMRFHRLDILKIHKHA